MILDSIWIMDVQVTCERATCKQMHMELALGGRIFVAHALRARPLDY